MHLMLCILMLCIRMLRMVLIAGQCLHCGVAALFEMPRPACPGLCVMDGFHSCGGCVYSVVASFVFLSQGYVLAVLTLVVMAGYWWHVCGLRTATLGFPCSVELLKGVFCIFVFDDEW